jgi:hypothetical protein
MAPIDASSFDFPHPVLTKIGDNKTEPTFASILVAHVELNVNAASIYSARGDGLQGHLALTIDATDYTKRSVRNKPLVPSTAPPAVRTNRRDKPPAQSSKNGIYPLSQCRHGTPQPTHWSSTANFSRRPT